jgi:hypothetical protein
MRAMSQRSESITRSVDNRAWRVDTKALVGGVLLGIVLVLVNQVATRLDAIVNPSAGFVSGSATAIILGLTVRLFRQPAGLIAGEIQAIIAIVTATNPLAPAFLITNAVEALAYSAALRVWPQNTWLSHFLTQVAGNLFGDIVFMLAVIVLLHVPFEVALTAIILTFVVNLILSTIITKPLTDAVERSGVAD